MADIPTIWTVRRSESGDHLRLRFLKEQKDASYEATPHGLLVNLDMTREEAASLRDVLTVALDQQ